MADLSRLPVDSPIAVAPFGDPRGKNLPKLFLGDDYQRWLSEQRAKVDEKPSRKAVVNLQAQAASIGTTPLPIPTVTQGLWRISVTVRVTTPGTVSSSIQVTLAWTERGVVQLESGAALAGNLTTTREGKTFIIRADGTTPISYSTTYATAGATPMQYSLDIVAEELAVDA